METDSLIRSKEGATSRDEKGSSVVQWCQIIATWAVVAAVVFLTVVLLADIRLRGHDVGTESTGAATVKVSDAVPSSSLPATPAPRYHATQFLSFTINTLGGLAEYGECEDKNVDPSSGSCYLGDDDIETDVHHRLAIFEDTLSILRYAHKMNLYSV